MLFLLLGLPIIIGLAEFMFGRGKIVWQEFAIQEIAVILVVSAGYFIALMNKTVDVEIWNGTITSKNKVVSGCCHSYPCNCHEECSGSGKNRSCYTHCDTCYRHSSDYSYTAYTSNNEEAFGEGCFAPYSNAPQRWASIEIGEPTSIEHSYDNYVMANPDTIIKRTGAKEKYQKSIPIYPRVYDYYRAKHFIYDGVKVSSNDAALAEKVFDDLNGFFGASKKINVIVILTSVADQAYIEAIREAWIGGKKNDLIVVIGTPDYPKIAWAGVVSWTKDEDVKINIRNDLLDKGIFDRNEVAVILRDHIWNHFKHRSWREFDYLRASIQPSNTILWTLFIIGVIMSIALTIVFYKNDYFE